MERRLRICFYLGLLLMLGCADEILLRAAKTSLDLLNLSQPLWSGLAKSLAWCGSLCAGEPHCVSLLFNNTEKSCKIFNMLHPLDDSTEEVEYYMIERASNRKLPESCVDLANCSGTSTDGEYWIYPKATSGQRLKVYCHNMGTNPTEYLTLKYTNTFVQHDGSNWIIQWKQCQSNYKTPLKQATFSKIAINIQDMTVIGTDYTFASLTGDFNLPFGTTADCAGESFRSNCPYFGNAVINSRGTGMILDQNITWSVVKGWMTAIRNLQRSVDGAEISFQCAGWCGKCGPSSEPIKLLLSSEIVADVEANAEVCTV
ncbi:A disintegrin and metalloproteinase with thrombospondin motifs 9-like isoform X1 [Ostrea edulis]|uniref:A disintegrin and metalloproteinase with thrombospondin motifs 9-like isoform X1 n=1 Tax=Ostrea edulis TaxID=37623 RepID=UPI0024AFA60E|nr:A disintegrin and metalloproteinase with thrombospondin motifs 9-like isoform X1 [Ostrea edulis]